MSQCILLLVALIQEYYINRARILLPREAGIDVSAKSMMLYLLEYA